MKKIWMILSLILILVFMSPLHSKEVYYYNKAPIATSPNYAVLTTDLGNMTNKEETTNPPQNNSQNQENSPNNDTQNQGYDTFTIDNKTYNVTFKAFVNPYILFKDVKDNLTKKEGWFSSNKLFTNPYLLFKDIKEDLTKKEETIINYPTFVNPYLLLRNVTSDLKKEEDLWLAPNQIFVNPIILLYILIPHKIIRKYNYSVNVTKNFISLSVTTSLKIPPNSKIKIIWGDGKEIEKDVQANKVYNFQHTYKRYSKYKVSILGLVNNEKKEEYNFTINTQHYGKGYLNYYYKTDEDLNTDITLNLKIEGFSDVLEELKNVSFYYNITDEENNTLLEKEIILNLTKDQGYNYSKKFTESLTFLEEGNYTFNFRVKDEEDNFVNSPFIFRGNFTLNIKRNSHQGNYNASEGEENGGIISGGGGKGGATYNYSFNNKNINEYKGINLGNITYENLTNPQSNLLGKGIYYFINEGLVNFIKTFLIFGTTWEGLGALLSIILFAIRKRGEEILYFAATWEFVGFILYIMGMNPLKFSLITFTLGNQIVVFLMVIIIGLLLYYYFRG